ncbi:MAG: mucoidy inhibitor MuiA family protein [Sphingobacteriaceae bacterium]|nr:mucoidy inhibitor MuiA family protein [Cytophagaceae bacterium]
MHVPSRFLFVPLFSLLLLSGLLAQTPIVSTLENVTVFQNGAQLSRRARIALPAGKTELLYRGLSPKLDKTSLQVRGQGQFMVLSVVAQTGLAPEKTSEEQTALAARRDALEERLAVAQKMAMVYRQEEAMLLKNQELGGRTVVLKASDLKESVDFQRARLIEVLLKQVETEKAVKRLQAELKILDAQQTRLNAEAGRAQAEVLVTVRATEALPQARFELTYFVPDAGWIPAYDVRVTDLARPLTLAYRANVFQFSGEDWNAVRLTLSTADPRQRGDKPSLSPWYYGTSNNYPQPTATGLFNPRVSQVYGRVTAKNGDALPGVTVQLKGTTLGAATDGEGYYKLAIPPRLSGNSGILVFSAVGFVSDERVITEERLDLQLKEDVVRLQEVVVGYADQSLAGRIAGVNVQKRSNSVPIDIDEREAPTSISFEIKTPYTVPSDGKSYSVEIKEEAVPAKYEHAAVPKISPDVFLTAKLVDWERLNLLPGEVSLFLESTFVGKTQIDLRRTTDTLAISLGRDALVQVKRTKLREQSRNQFFSGNRVESVAYEISVRNTRRQPIALVLEDQFPLSRFKEVSVQDREAPDAAVDETTCILTWRLTVEPAREQKVNFRYAVKAPKSGVVVVN